MKCLERNKTTFYYALYLGKTQTVDEYGNLTGGYDVSHGNPILAKGNVSAARGETATRQFGENENYDKVIVLDDPAVEIDENAILWVDTMPVIVDGVTDTPHDYVVKKVARSLNSVSVAISKVTVSA